MKSIEKEIKQLLTISEYNTLLDAFNNIAECEVIVQVNYYFDDNAYSLYNNKGDTLRVSQKQNILMLKRKFNKCYSSNEVRVCMEYSESIDSLPMRIVLNGNEYYYVGNLVTVRRNYKIDNNMISLDTNYYLGQTDYELEIEYDTEVTVPSIIKEVIKIIEGKFSSV